MPRKKEYWKNPEKYREWSKTWANENREKATAASARWAKQNPEKRITTQQKYYKKNKQLVIKRNRVRKRALKVQCVKYLGGKCSVCGLLDDCMNVYCFHHRDPSQKDFTISSRKNKFERMVDELDKCDLICQNCHRKEHTKYYDEANKQHRFRKRRKEKAASLFGGSCADCGVSDDPCIYDFHHSDPSKKNFSFREYHPWEETKNELKKCIMLCANCHNRRRTLGNGFKES